MKIYEAVSVVLNERNAPLSMREIYQAICDRKLYEFRAKDPLAVVTKAVRTRLKEKVKAGVKPVFIKGSDGKIDLIR